MKDIIFEKNNNTGIITFNKEHDMNCLNAGFIGDITQIIDDTLSDPDIFLPEQARPFRQEPMSGK